MAPSSDGLLDRYASAEDAARAVIQSPALLDAAVSGIDSARAAVRFHSSKALLELARLCPAALLPRLDALLALLDSDNKLIRSAAFRTLGHVAPVDRQGRITRSIPRFLAPLSGPDLVVANNAIEGAALVAAARPRVTDRVVLALLAVPDGTWRTPECRLIVAGKAASALRTLAPRSARKPEIEAFIAAWGAPRRKPRRARRAAGQH